MKICSSCKNELPFENFGKYKNSKDGYRGTCKSCRKQKRVERKQAILDNQVDPPDSKICYLCNTEKNIEEFNKSSYSMDGYEKRCRECLCEKMTVFHWRKSRNLDSSVTKDEIFKLREQHLEEQEAKINATEKHCTVCKVLKNIEEFSIDNAKRSKRDSRCKECTKKYFTNYYSKDKNKKKVSEYAKKYREENAEAISVSNAEYHKCKLEDPEYVKRRKRNKKEYESTKHG